MRDARRARSSASLFPGKVLALPAVAVGLLLFSCSSTSVPSERLYLLPLPEPARGPGKKREAPSKKGPFLVILPVKGSGLFRGNLLWARVSDMEVEPWVRHRWALPAPEVVQDALVRWARAAGRFSGVSEDSSAAERGGLLLEGMLEALEEVDAPGRVQARIRLELTLFKKDPLGGRSRAWRGVVEEMEPVGGKSAADVVRALGRAFRRGMDGVLEEWVRAGFLGKGAGE